MRVGTLIQQAHASVISLGIVSSEFDETGAAIVLSVNPLRLLVPSHLVLAIEDGSADGVTLDGSTFRDVTLLCSPILEQHELAVLQIDQTSPSHLRPIRLGSGCADAYPGQIGVLVTHHSVSAHCQSGPVLSVRSDGRACMAVLDVDVRPGDSGSAVLIDGVLAGVVQGRRLDESGTKAIAVLLSETLGSELRKLAEARRPRLTKATAIPLVVALYLCLASAPLPNHSALFSSEAVLPPTGQDSGAQTRHFNVGAMPHAIELVGDRCLIAQIDTGALLDFDPQAEALHEISRSLSQPCDMAATGGNSVLCVNEAGMLVEIDTLTGLQIGSTSAQELGLLPDDIVMGIDATQGTLSILFYRDEGAQILCPEVDEEALSVRAAGKAELCGLQAIGSRFYTLAWQDMMLCEIVQQEGYWCLVDAVDISDYLAASELASEGLRNFYLDGRTLYLVSISYDQLCSAATLHLLTLEEDL